MNSKYSATRQVVGIDRTSRQSHALAGPASLHAIGCLTCVLVLLTLAAPDTVSAYTRSEQLPGLSGFTSEQFLYLRYSMAYHTRRGQMILLVHGILDEFVEGEGAKIYGLVGGQWQPILGAPAGLSVMIYDSKRGVMVFWQGRAVNLGVDPAGVRRKRVGWTWEWDGTNWRLASDRATIWELGQDNQWRRTVTEIPYGEDMEDLRSSPGPETDPHHAVFNQTVGFDPRRGRVVMLGGIASLRNRIVGYVYEWDGAAWRRNTPMFCDASPSDCQPFEPSSSPFSVQAAAMAFHPPSGRMIIHGGLGQPAFYFFTNRSTSISFRTYSYDGERVYQHTQPGPVDIGLRRVGHAMVWDELAQRLVMFGGQTYNLNFDPIPDRGEDCWNVPTERFDLSFCG